MSKLHYDPFSAEAVADPYPFYQRLRDEAPIYWIERRRAWALSRFADIWEAVADNRFGAVTGTTSFEALLDEQPEAPSYRLLDPEQQVQMRRAVQPHFSRRAVSELEDQIRSLVLRCLEQAASRGQLDVVIDLGIPVGVLTAASILGTPASHLPILLRLVAQRSTDGLHRYFQQWTAARRAQSGGPDDLLASFLGLEIDGQPMDDESIAHYLSIFLLGGSETFPYVLASMVQRVAEHPEQRELLIEEPERVDDAVQETLRYDMPTQYMCRRVVEDLEIHGQTLKAGDTVVLLYASGNRDPREYEEPDRFDIRRRAQRILTFGGGVYYCLGMHGARLEGRLCLQELLARFPRYQLVSGKTKTFQNYFFRGISSLPISL